MARKSDHSWRDILLPEGMIEDLLKTSFHLDEKQCRGFFAAVESLLKVQYPKYENYLKVEVRVVHRRYGDLLVVK
jgi:hypothetical protein